MLARLCPCIEERVQLFELYEQVLGGSFDRSCTAEGADGIDQVGRRVGGAALAAVVSVFPYGFATRAGSLDESVGKEGARLGVKELFNVIFADQSCIAERTPDLFAQLIVLRRIGAAIMIKGDIEACKILFVGGLHVGDQLGLRTSFLTGSDHDRRTMGIVGADKNASAAS